MTLFHFTLNTELIQHYCFDGASGYIDTVGHLNAEEIVNGNGQAPQYVSGTPSENIRRSPQKGLVLQSSTHTQRTKTDVDLNVKATVCL